MSDRAFRDLLARDDTYVRVGGRYRRLRVGDDGLVIYIKVGERRYVQMVADDGPPLTETPPPVPPVVTPPRSAAAVRACPGCGLASPPTSRFCTKCGRSLTEAGAQAAPPPPRPSVRPPAATPRPPTPRSVPPPAVPPTPPRRVPPPENPVRPSPDRDEPRREPVQVELVTTWPTPDDQGLAAKAVRAVKVVDREAGTAFTGCLWWIAMCIGLGLVLAILAAIFGDGGR